MKNLERKKFEAAEEAFPDEIIQEQCELLRKLTNGIVIAEIKKYESEIRSYAYKTGGALSGFTKMFAEETVNVNIQDHLGNVDEGIFIFELYLTSATLPNYKYRIMFLQYEIPGYPASIILDETIAAELKKDSTEISCGDQKNFEDLMDKILTSKKVENVIAALLRIALKKTQGYENTVDDDNS